MQREATAANIVTASASSAEVEPERLGDVLLNAASVFEIEIDAVDLACDELIERAIHRRPPRRECRGAVVFDQRETLLGEMDAACIESVHALAVARDMRNPPRVALYAFSQRLLLK